MKAIGSRIGSSLDCGTRVQFNLSFDVNDVFPGFKEVEENCQMAKTQSTVAKPIKTIKYELVLINNEVKDPALKRKFKDLMKELYATIDQLE
jgi:hypothetical protein